jgi:MoxR-like ATPase
MISFGCSPRASINLAIAAKAYAFLQGRAFVVPEDVRAIAPDVMRHRMGLTYEAEAENITSQDVVNKIIAKVEVP